MSRAVSIHVGVNQPRGRYGDRPLRHSESTAWSMAGLASRAGYESMLVLRGQAATRQAVHAALSGAAGTLEGGDTLLVTFSGHGSLEPDRDMDERLGFDQSWCLHDGILLDDKLAGYWRLFEPGVRIVLVSESCYGGGMGRGDECGPGATMDDAPPRIHVVRAPVGVRYRSAPGDDDLTRSCIAEAPRNSDEIRASVLLLSASSERQAAQDGLFTCCLLRVWEDGAFQGSYCDLYRRVSELVRRENSCQDPQIQMLGAADPAFAVATAFHREPQREPGRRVRYR